MTALRHADLAIVERRKLVDYLLNDRHPDNGGKAGFFASLGFTADTADALAEALRQVARTGDVVETAESPHGEKTVVDGWVSAHTGDTRPRRVRTVWIVDRGREAPRLVTAYPHGSTPPP